MSEMSNESQEALQAAHFEASLEKAHSQSTVYDSEGERGNGATGGEEPGPLPEPENER